jgi:DNA repair ATPase RecN
MPVTFPLNKIPEIPPRLTSFAVDTIVDFLNKIIEKLLKLVDEATKLPDDVSCDDTRIGDLLNELNDVMELIRKLQEIIPKIQEMINLFKTLSDIATTVKSSLYLIPVVGQAVATADLSLVQTMTIENAKKSLEQLQTIPSRLNIGIDLAVSELTKVANRLAQACSGAENINTDLLTVPNEIKDSIDNFNRDNDFYNDQLDSEFYQLKNVSIDDLDERADSIRQLIDQQRDLLTSLQEAPSKVLSGAGPPSNELGKSGDYYVDISSNQVYGPKINTGWA